MRSGRGAFVSCLYEKMPVSIGVYFIGMAGRQGWRPDNGDKTWNVLRWLLLDTYVPISCFGGYESVVDGCTDGFYGSGEN